MIMPSQPLGDKGKKRRARYTEEALSPMALYSAEAEKAVLGCMLAQPKEVIDEASEVLTEEDFFVPAHQSIFEALIGMWKNQRAIDVMTVHDWLTDWKIAEEVGSPGILGELLVGFATHLNVGSYIRIVKDKSTLRHLQSACSAIVRDIADNPDGVSAILDRAEFQIMAVSSSGLATVGDSKPGYVMDAEVARIVSYDGKREIQGIPSGFHELDRLTGGWKPGEMIVLAARPGVGKTALSLDFMHAAAKERWSDDAQNFVQPGYSVGMISLEMPEQQIELRRLSKQSGLGLQMLRRGLEIDSDRQKLQMSREDMRPWRVDIRHRSYCTIIQARSIARKMKRERNIDLLVIDYLQLLAGDLQAKSYDNRQNEVASISKGTKAIAMELGIPVIILAQLNRKNEEANRPPELHNLRESGAIEQDADVVLLLHRIDLAKDADGNERPTAAVMEYLLKLAKQRNGPTDELKILFNTCYARFEQRPFGTR